MRQRTPLETVAKQLRKNSTNAERKLWAALRNRQLAGFKFRRQLPIGPYVADFVCVESKLVIELDGGQHQSRQIQDEKRSAYLSRQGFQVLRFWNDQALQETSAALQMILDTLQASPHPNPLPSQARGEGVKS